MNARAMAHRVWQQGSPALPALLSRPRDAVQRFKLSGERVAVLVSLPTCLYLLLGTTRARPSQTQISSLTGNLEAPYLGLLSRVVTIPAKKGESR